MAGTNLGTAYVQIVPSAQGISGSIGKALNGEAGTAGTKVGATIAGKIKGAIVAAGIGAAVTAGLKTALTEGANLQQSYIGGLDTLYGEAADQARRYADEAVKAGISQNSFAEQAVSFGAALKQAYGGDTTKAMEAANTAILDMADNAAKMGTPLESIQDAYQGFAKQNYTMLDNLKLGYGGTKSEMERLLADAEELSGKEYNIENLGDVYDAIHVIQEDLGLTNVAADEAATTFSGSMGAMKAAFDNLMGNMMLGQNVDQSMKNLVDTTTTFLIGNLFPAIGNIIKSLPVAIGTFMESDLPKIMEAGKKLITSLANGATKELPKLIEKLMKGLVGLSGKMRSGFSKFVDLGLGLIKSVANGIIKSIPVIIQTAPKIISNFAGIMNDNAPKIILTGINIIVSLVKGIIKAIPVLVKNLPQIGKAIFDVFMAMSWGGLGRSIVKGLGKGLKNSAGSVKDAAKKICENIINRIKAIPAKIQSSIRNIKTKLMFAGLAAKVKEVFDKVKSKITEPLQSAKNKIAEIIDSIKNKFPFSLGKILKFRVPTINIKTSSKTFLGKTITYPTGFSIGWSSHAKAMDNPYLFNKPTIFGAGEAGDEIMYGRRALMRDISEAVSRGGESSGDVVINLYYTASDDANVMVRDLAREVKRYRMAGAI